MYSEADVMKIKRLEATENGAWLSRNNVGAYIAPNGQMIRYGLANDSKQVNKRTKSCDLIGIKPILITPQHIGMIIGQFIGFECKRQGWKYSGTNEEKGQLNFINIINSYGGDIRFSTGEKTL